MSCTKCKKKVEIRKIYDESKVEFGIGVVIGAISWTLLGFYGLYNMLIKIYEFF